MAGHSEADSTGRSNGAAHGRRQAAQEAFGMVIRTDHRHWAGPTAARHALAEQSHMRDVVDRLVGTFNSQRQWRLAGRPAFCGKKPSDGRLIERAGSQSVDRFRWK